MSVSVAAKHTCKTTGEGPFWEEGSKSLVYVDIMAGDVHKWNSLTGEDSKLELGGNISFIIPRTQGGYIIGRDRALTLLDWDTAALTTVATVDEGTNNRLNDAKCDASGRLWAGTMGHEPAPAQVQPGMGSLYSLDSSHNVTRQKDKVDLSNGLAWTKDTKTMFFVDSVPRKIYAFDFDINKGAISNERVALAFPSDSMSELGYPDGMCIDLDDKIWLACYSAGKVIRYDMETGQAIHTIKFPALATTSCCWGGPNYDELYVTCSSRNLSPEEVEKQSAGSVFKVTGLGAKGCAAPTYNG